MSDRAVFLDRDGILVRAVVRHRKPYPPSGPDTMEIFPGIDSYLAQLKAKGFRLIVITNQVDVGRGTQTREVVELMHAHLMRALPLDDIFVCYRDDETERKKPSAGMLLEAADKWTIDLKKSYMVGDRSKDVEAGRRAGCRSVFVEYAYDEPLLAEPDHIAKSPPDALAWILREG